MGESSTHRRQVRPSGEIRVLRHHHSSGSATQYLMACALIGGVALALLPGVSEHLKHLFARATELLASGIH